MNIIQNTIIKIVVPIHILATLGEKGLLFIIYDFSSSCIVVESKCSFKISFCLATIFSKCFTLITAENRNIRGIKLYIGVIVSSFLFLPNDRD